MDLIQRVLDVKNAIDADDTADAIILVDELIREKESNLETGNASSDIESAERDAVTVVTPLSLLPTMYAYKSVNKKTTSQATRRHGGGNVSFNA